jgi:hypothetical protein
VQGDKIVLAERAEDRTSEACYSDAALVFCLTTEDTMDAGMG